MDKKDDAPSNEVSQTNNGIIFTSFNQDQGCFACGTENGFKIFNSFPFKDSHQRKFDGGIGIVEMMFRTNILALVGGGDKPKFAANKVFLWDDLSFKCIGELSFKTNVRAVKLTKDKIVVVLEQRTYIYNFDDLRLIDAIETCPNTRGLVALNPDPDNAVLATPDKTIGNVRVNAYEKNKSIQIPAHQNALSAMCLNFAGTLLATASDRGTLIRIHSTENGQSLQELRRGKEKADIDSICFDLKGGWLACSSDRSTIHIFTVNIKADQAGIKLSDEEAKADTNEDNHPENKKSGFKFMKAIGVTYFDSEWSFAKFKIPNDDNSDNHTCAFSQDGTHMVVVSKQGTYYLAQIPKNGGNCKIQLKKKLVE